jgi:hypothetical protein
MTQSAAFVELRCCAPMRNTWSTALFDATVILLQ